MQETIKKMLNASIASSAVAAALGILFLIFPAEALDVFRWIIAILAFAVGGLMLFNELSRRKSSPQFGATVIAAVFIVVGFIFATRPAATNIFSIILGAWFIVSAIGTLRLTMSLKGSTAFMSALLALVSFIAGILLITNPWGGSVSIMVLLGVGLLVYGVSNAINTYVFKSNLKELARRLESAKKKQEKESEE